MMSKVIIFGLLALGVAVADAADGIDFKELAPNIMFREQDERNFKELAPSMFRENLNSLCPNAADEIKDDVSNNLGEKGYQCSEYFVHYVHNLESDMVEFKSKYNAAEAAILLCNKAKKYMECAEMVQETLKPCYSNDDDLRLLNLTYGFACGNTGERLARFITEGGVECFEKSRETLFQNLLIKLKEIMDISNIREFSRIMVEFTWKIVKNFRPRDANIEKQCDYSDDIWTIVDQAFANCTSSYPTDMAKEYLKKYKELIGCPEPATPPNAPVTTMRIHNAKDSGIELGENNTL